MREKIIEARNIVNRFGAQTVHNGLNLELHEREILGLVGGSGSGKSVLLRTILGLINPTSGDVLIRGDNIADMNRAERMHLNENWGVLFQNGALFSSLNVADNIGLPIREHFPQLDQASIDKLALMKLQMVGLQPETGLKPPSALSGGMARRAGLARALALDPSILFLDEPTVGLDPIAANAFDELILSLRDMLGLSVLLITHDLDSLIKICDRIAMIVDKKIIAGTLDEMLASDHPTIKAYFHSPRMRTALATDKSQAKQKTE